MHSISAVWHELLLVVHRLVMICAGSVLIYVEYCWWRWWAARKEQKADLQTLFGGRK